MLHQTRMFYMGSHFQVLSMAVFTLEDEQIVWMDKSSGIWTSDVNLCRTVVDLFVSRGKSSRRTNIRRFVHQRICSSRFHIRLFVHLRRFVQTTCSSSSVIKANDDFWNHTPETRMALLNLWVPVRIWQRFTYRGLFRKKIAEFLFMTSLTVNSWPLDWSCTWNTKRF